MHGLERASVCLGNGLDRPKTYKDIIMTIFFITLHAILSVLIWVQNLLQRLSADYKSCHRQGKSLNQLLQIK